MDNQGKMQKYKEDTILVREGEVCPHLCKVVSGKVGLYQHYGEKDEYLIAILAEHRYFGEVSFFTGQPSDTTAVAVTDLLILETTKEDFEDFIVRNARNAIDIMEHLARSVYTLNHHLEMVAGELTSQLEKGKGVPIDLKKKILEYKRFPPF